VVLIYTVKTWKNLRAPFLRESVCFYNLNIY
jgi:hypothetical protein